MLKAVAGVGRKVGKGQLRTACERVALAYEYVDLCVKEGVEARARVGKSLL